MRAGARLLMLAFCLGFTRGVTCTIIQDSLIKSTLRGSVLWQLQSSDCTSIHTVNISNGDIVWQRSPVPESQEWSFLPTDKRTFYTLKHAPAVFAVALDHGSLRWSWPSVSGFALWKHWDVDLPQDVQLAQPLPAIASQLLLLRAMGEYSKVYALNVVNGSLAWKWDGQLAVGNACIAAGLGPALSVSVKGWLLGGPDTVYLQMASQVNASGGDAVAAELPSHHQTLQQQSGTPHLSLRAGGAGKQAADFDGVEPNSQPAPPLTQSVGWVVALDLRNAGNPLWVAGPYAEGVAHLTLSEAALLVASAPDAAGQASLYGVHKASGTQLYTLACPGGDCSVNPVDTRTALLLGPITQPPLSLKSLSAFDLETGDLLWRGVLSSQRPPLASGQCTAVVQPRRHAYFACTCQATDNNATREQLDVRTRSAGGPEGGVGFRAQPPVQGPGLCAYAVDVETGKLAFEVLLSYEDTVPDQASEYNLAPLAMADTVVFTGRRGLWSMSRIPASAPSSTSQSGSTLQSGSQDSSSRSSSENAPSSRSTGTDNSSSSSDVRRSSENVLSRSSSSKNVMSSTSNGRGSDAWISRGTTSNRSSNLSSSSSSISSSHVRRDTGTTSNSSHINDNSDDDGLLSRPLFSWALPPGLAMASWDWLELKAGALFLRASPEPDSPNATHLHSLSHHLSHNLESSLSRIAGAAGAATTAGTAGTAATTGRDQTQGVSPGAIAPPQGSVQRAHRQPPPPPPAAMPSSWLFSLNPSNGSVLWSLALNTSIGPLAHTASAHVWGRGGLLILDGCQPKDPLYSSPPGSGDSRQAAGGARHWGVERRRGWTEEEPEEEEDPTSSAQPAGTGSVGGWRRARDAAWLVLQQPTSALHDMLSGGPGCQQKEGARKANSDVRLGGEAITDGSSACCLLAVSLATGQIQWELCYDMDSACSENGSRTRATTLVYWLLATQLVLLLLGLGSSVVCHLRSRSNAQHPEEYTEVHREEDAIQPVMLYAAREDAVS